MKTRAVILAGGEGARLGILTAKRAKPAVPFAGKYRIIDFTLSNCVNSGIFDVMILAQYRPHSLIEHIGAGGPWDLNRDFTGGLRLYTPYKGRGASDWYIGTADAVQQNFSFIQGGMPDLVLILSGDHIYEMNYDPLITFHRDHYADLTMATIRVPKSEARRFGIVHVDDQFQVTSFVEKPDKPPSTLANMGVYIFNLDVLDRVLWEDYQITSSSHDFGKDILPYMLAEGYKVFAYPHTGYWVDVGTIETYWQAHMDLLGDNPSIDLNDRSWIIHTRTEERPPVRIAQGANIIDSMITDGCVIAPGCTIDHSILGPGVRVNTGAVIRESVVLTDCVVECGASVERTILDKRVVIGENARIGQISKSEPFITMIGKNSRIAPGLVIEAGAVIGTDIQPEDLPAKIVRKGDYIQTGKKPHEI